MGEKTWLLDEINTTMPESNVKMKRTAADLDRKRRADDEDAVVETGAGVKMSGARIIG